MNETKDAIEEKMMDVLMFIFMSPLKLQADMARSEALYIAALASQGMISSICPVSKFPNGCWRITQKGIKKLEESDNQQLLFSFNS